MMNYFVGQRVFITEECHWAQLATGIISEPVFIEGEDWNGLNRIVHSEKGPMVFYFVEFDVPQNDVDGDGPYRGGEIQDKYLRLLEE